MLRAAAIGVLANSRFITRFQPAQDCLHIELQIGQVMFHHQPNCIQVNTKIVVDQNIPHPDNVAPWHTGITRLKLVWQRTAGFANDFDMMYNLGLDQFVRVEGSPAPHGVFLDSFNGIQNIPQTFGVVSHNERASFSIRGRRRGRSPASVTTSTFRSNRRCKSMSRPPKSSKLRPGSRSTRKSKSLLGPASPRATDPNRRTLRAPRRAASCRIVSRLLCTNSSSSIGYPLPSRGRG